MAWTTPRTWVAGEVVTAALMNAQIRDNVNAVWPLGDPTAAWTPFTPALTNITIGNGVLTCSYMRTGRWVVARYSFVWGTTTSASGSQVFALPVAAHAIYIVNSHVGSANVLDGAVASYGGYTCTIITGATNFGLEAAGAGSFVNATVPVAFGNTDGITAHVVYEAAA